MLLHGKIFIRKIIAAFLLFLFAFIYIEKAFHKHEKQITCDQELGITLTAKGTVCSICDFQVAKDVLLSSPGGLDKPLFFLETGSGFQPAYIYSPPTWYLADRAPPFS